MPYKTAIDCIEELATQYFLSKLTDDDVSTFRRACSRENDIIKLALKVPQTVDYTSILRLLYDTLPLKFLSFNEALPLFCYSIDPAQQRQCDLRFYLRDVVKLAKPRKRLEMQKALSQWLPSLLSNVTLQLLNDIRTRFEEIQPDIRQTVLQNYGRTGYPSLDFEHPNLGVLPETDSIFESV